MGAILLLVAVDPVTWRDHKLLTAAHGQIERGALTDHPWQAAQVMLNAVIHRRLGASVVRARIVEVEFYDESDPASHSFGGKTLRNASMFAVAGTAYVYRAYGVHWCLNVAVGDAGRGAAILIRAAMLGVGAPAVRGLRGDAPRDRLLSGPGRLTRGLAISGPEHDGMDLLASRGGLRLLRAAHACDQGVIECGPRVGVSRAHTAPLRFWLAGNPCVSPYRKGRTVSPQR